MVVRLVVAATLLGAVHSAHADDTSMFVNLGGSIGVGTSIDGNDHLGRDYEPEGTLAGRLTLSWEPPPLPYREPRGLRVAGALVPEVTIGYLRVADHRTGDPDDNTDGFVMLGGRLELRVSQRKMGLLEVSARGGIYLAGRVGLLTDADRTPVAEFAFGEHIFLGDRFHIGGEFGISRYFGEQFQTFVDPAARAPWRDGDGQYLAFQATLYAGWAL